MEKDKRGKYEIPALVDLRKAQLTKAAFSVVSERGYYNFTMMDIAKEAGVSSGLVHYYFKNKQGLLLNLLREMQENVRKKLYEALQKAQTPLEELEIFIEEAFTIIERNPNYFYVMFDFLTQIKRNKQMKEMMKKLYQSYRSVLSMILQKGIDKKVFMKLDVNYLSVLIISLVQSTVIQYMIDNEAFSYKDYADKVKQSIFSIVLNNKQIV
ncbi:MAG: TetR family transcriptional regulator [Deltaproteobacteria bacterium]|nr:TetR family transcriptional regulator [Deltaproteobacteria bacterium]